jgi:hypothetical protein
LLPIHAGTGFQPTNENGSRDRRSAEAAHERHPGNHHYARGTAECAIDRVLVRSSVHVAVPRRRHASKADDVLVAPLLQASVCSGQRQPPELIEGCGDQMHLGARSRGRGKLVVGVAVLALALPARAERLNAGATDRVALHFPTEAVVTLVERASVPAPALFSKQLAPGQCRSCGGKTADKLSLVTALAPSAVVISALIAKGPRATLRLGISGSF